MRTWGRRLLFTLQFYTTIPVRVSLAVDERDCAWTLSLAPLAGLLIGFLSMLVFEAASNLTRFAGVGLAMLTALLLSGGLHMDGLADTCDGIFCRKPREAALQVMKDSHTGAFGVMGIVMVMILRFSLLMDSRFASQTILLAPMLGRVAMAAAAASAQSAKPDGMGRAFIQPCGTVQAVLALVLAAVCTLGIAGFRGVGALAAVFFWGFLCARYFERRFGGLTGDLLGAICETGELLAMLCMLLAVY